MKTAETKTASTSHLHQTGHPFFQKNGESAFFSDSQTEIQTKPFFSKQAAQPFIQTKLTIGRPGDKYEQDADAMADRVVQRLSNPETIQTKPATSLGNTVTPLVQPKCAACEKEEQLQKKEEDEDRLEQGIQLKPVFESDEPPPKENIQRKCAECLSAEASGKEGEAEEKLQKKGETGSSENDGTPSLESRLNATRGSGSPLPENSRTQMESAFGTDFSNVRIHTGSSAVQMNQELAAQAFTHGSDIYFNSRKYNPENTEGKHLLAHELTHTVQQSGNNPIQRQEQSEIQVNRDFPSSSPGGERSTRASRCYTDPEFPDFRCLAYALKLDIDENLWNNAHHFYRVASLYPDNNELMWNTFLRYGLGVNLLKTSFGFLGTDETLGSVLSYGTGVGLKSYEFFTNGRLELDVPIPLVRGINLDLKLDLNADPENITDIQGVQTGVGISGHF